MTIGDVIKKYRKSKGLTQEEMAARLGVTAPAVNKWERGGTLPDVALLAPIARLLQRDLESKGFHDGFLSATEKIEE